MEIFELIQKLLAGEAIAAEYIVGLITDQEADRIARTQYDEEPSRFTGPTALKALADETFGGMKHFLRGKVGGAIDIAWNIGAVRRPLRVKANAAAKKELESAVTGLGV